jgi:hypothetical protein
MALSILDDKSRQPDDKDLTNVLGSTKQLWDDLVNHVVKGYEPITKEWGFSGEKYGWLILFLLWPA